jgi:hypothetical protein
MKPLGVLIGLTISEIVEIHGYIQFFFFGGTILTMYGTYVCEGCSLPDLKNSRVISAKDLGDIAVIVFDDEKSISISLKEEDYEGPEAMVLRVEGAPTVVWN